jgi:hypothetical protein
MISLERKIDYGARELVFANVIAERDGIERATESLGRSPDINSEFNLCSGVRAGNLLHCNPIHVTYSSTTKYNVTMIIRRRSPSWLYL